MIYVARMDYNDNDWYKWNEMMARVIEVFGLPGDRYITSLHVDSMSFNFNDERDRLLFLTGWPAYIPKGIE